MAKRGFEYLETDKRQLEVAARYAFALIAAPKARRFEAKAKQSLGIAGDGIYASIRVGQGGAPFWFLKSRTLNPEHPDAAKTNGTINAASTEFTQQGRNEGSDEWRQYLNLFKARDGRRPLIDQDPLRRNFLRQGELWVVSGYRPETPADVEQLTRLDTVLARTKDTVLRGRQQFRPGAACESAAWRHQFTTGRTDQVLAASLAMEAHYFDTASLQGDLEFMRSVNPRLADFSSNMIGKNPVTILERIAEATNDARFAPYYEGPVA